MKYLFVFVVLVLFANKSNAQFLQAGDHTGYYHDFVPDTTAQFIGSATSQSVSITFDVDNNTANDITINKTTGYGSFATSSSFAYISGTDTTIQFFIGRIDSTYLAFYNTYIVTNVPKIYDYMDTIQPGLATEQKAFFTSSGHIGSSSYSVTDWVGVGEKYVGFTYYNGAGLDLGWIRVYVDSIARITIKDFDLNSSVVGLHQLKKEEVSVFPNPVSDKVYIRIGGGVNHYSIYDQLGSEVLSGNDKQADTTLAVDVSELNPGLYHISFSSEGKTSGTTFIVGQK